MNGGCQMNDVRGRGGMACVSLMDAKKEFLSSHAQQRTESKACGGVESTAAGLLASTQPCSQGSALRCHARQATPPTHFMGVRVWVSVCVHAAVAAGTHVARAEGASAPPSDPPALSCRCCCCCSLEGECVAARHCCRSVAPSERQWNRADVKACSLPLLTLLWLWPPWRPSPPRALACRWSIAWITARSRHTWRRRGTNRQVLRFGELRLSTSRGCTSASSTSG